MNKDINNWCRECQQCSRGKVTKQPAAAVAQIPVPNRRFSHVHVDLVGPLPTSAEGFRYLFTLVDRSTRWVEAVPIKTMVAADCADAFITAWVSRFGVPAALTSDRGAQYTAAVWSALCLKLGISHQMTTAYHPQSNGMVERAHRQLKDALRSRLAGVQWPQHLPRVLLGLRAAPKEDSGISSAELTYGAPLSLPGQFITAEEPPPSGFVEKLRSASPPPPTRQPTYAEMAAKPPAALMVAKFVYVRRGCVVPPLEPLYLGPYQVLDNGPKVFCLAIGGRAESVSIDRLKPHLGIADVLPQRLPPRGRLPSRGVQSCPSGSTLAGGNVAATAAATTGNNM
jgi:hypothetical protein